MGWQGQKSPRPHNWRAIIPANHLQGSLIGSLSQTGRNHNFQFLANSNQTLVKEAIKRGPSQAVARICSMPFDTLHGMMDGYQALGLAR
jgi:hypothetical protein